MPLEKFSFEAAFKEIGISDVRKVVSEARWHQPAEWYQPLAD